MEIDEQEAARIFKALCDENRLHILKLLGTGEKCARTLLEEVHITQPTLSHHMRILCDSGIVTGRKTGKWIYYSISAEGAEAAMQCLRTYTRCRKRKRQYGQTALRP